jgi:hypothetical protein
MRFVDPAHRSPLDLPVAASAIFAARGQKGEPQITKQPVATAGTNRGR